MSEAVSICHARWDQPNPNFSHGEDRRSSDRAMLESLYGGLVRAANHDFQNAGRVLVDRTDVRMLLESYRLSLPVRPLDSCCREIEYLVRAELFPVWGALMEGERDSIDLDRVVRELVEGCFGGADFRVQALWLAFFLLPTLTVAPPRTAHRADSEDLNPPAELAVILPPNVGRDWWQRRLAWQQWFAGEPV